MAQHRRKLRRVAFYLRNIARDVSPQAVFRKRLDAILSAGMARPDRRAIVERVGYYNRLSTPFDGAPFAYTIATIPSANSFYYYDLKEHARYFPRRFGLNLEFGDYTAIAARPSFEKSRLIVPDNANSILMKLDKLRHFQFPEDPLRFAEKKPMAIWRGNDNNALRRALVERFGTGNPRVDAAFASRKPYGPGSETHVTEEGQSRYRYVISIEGIDVATNLKWIFASNSVCLMPAPTAESWFMEGKLVAGDHYVELRRDFADLEEKMDALEAKPAEALRIIANAQAFARAFTDEKREQLISLLVMAKYFVLTGQMEADGRLAALAGLRP